MITRLKEFFLKNERRISALAIISAFVVDSVTLVRIDEQLTIGLLLLYLIVVGVGIILINLYEDGRAQFLSAGAYMWLFIAVQFSFGGLFGRFLIYYSRSGSIVTSWPFLLLLLGLLVGNEFAKKHYTRLLLQVGFYFLCIFSFLIFFVPVVIGQMSDSIFFFSGLISLGVMFGFVRLLERMVPRRVHLRRHQIFGVILMVFGAINFLYFTNSIPPIPLAVRETGVYHSIVRTASGYHIAMEEPGSLDFLKPRTTVHLRTGDPLYAYSAIFAPTHFGTSIVHVWQHYDQTSGKWTNEASIPFDIYGGRDEGYRGYTFLTNLKEGLWRVSIQTLRGQVAGRINFEVVRVEDSVNLIGKDL